MKKVVSTSALAMVLALVLVVGIFYFHVRSESDGVNAARSVCELIELADLATNYYEKNNKYPDERVFLEIVEENLALTRCGRSLKVKENSIPDPWGEGYCYEHYPSHYAYIYSTSFQSEFYDLGKGGYINYASLHEGAYSIDKHFLENGSTKCGFLGATLLPRPAVVPSTVLR